MSPSAKLLEYSAAASIFERLRKEDKRIVQCHGTFDLIHPGHLIHFEEARALGDALVVTITAENFVNKGPGRPYFNDHLRAKSLAALEYVDYVVVVPYPAAVEAIELVQPDIYCKGKEYEDPGNDPTGNIVDDVETVKRLGGQVRYVGSVVYSSTRLLNRHFDTFEDPVKVFCRKLAANMAPQKVREEIEKFSQVKVLLIGDIIFDRYTTVRVQGLTSKDRILSGRILGDSLQPGGVLAVLRHLEAFTPHVKLVSLAGTENWANDELSRYVAQKRDGILHEEDFTTVVKRRFVEPLDEGKELQKLFATNTISRCHPKGEIVDHLHESLARELKKDYDLVLVMDFGHGVMTEPIRELVQNEAKFLALNCQTNSNNHGFNIINRQYQRADSFSLDEAELRLAAGKRDMDFTRELFELKQQLGANYCWLTRGPVETIGLQGGQHACACPPFETQVVDTVGAGDSFCALATLAVARGLPLELATFLGQLAGAQAVRVVGNTESIRKDRLIKGAMSMLTF